MGMYEEQFVFVYAKDGKIKALIFKEAKSRHDELISDGWVHTETIDACRYIQYLHNDCEEVIDEIMKLSV